MNAKFVRGAPGSGSLLPNQNRRPRMSWKLGAKLLFFALMVICGYCFALIFPWGRWPPYPFDDWPLWHTEPAQGADLDVLKTLLAQNRDEVRFWQGVLFNVSMVFTGGVLGIVSLALKTKALSELLRWVYAIAIVFLCTFYLIFVKVAENAIALNHRDLTGIEIGLKLAKEGAYLQGQPFYDHSEESQKRGKGESLIKQIVPFGILLAVLSAGALLFLPVSSESAGRVNDADSG